MNIKAIQTHYRGYHFRSRLEARWAVFFDALGVTWEYEPEGYVLSDGTRYLPDFWLPELGLYVEIKGTRPTADELSKARLLRDGIGRAVLVAWGVPMTAPSVLFAWDTCDSGGGSWEGQVTLWGWRQGAAGVYAHDDERCGRDRTLHLDGDFSTWLFTDSERFSADRGEALHAQAIAAARGARFEHGQSGASLA